MGSQHPYDFFKKKQENDSDSYFRRLQRNLAKKPTLKMNSYYMIQNLKK